MGSLDEAFATLADADKLATGPTIEIVVAAWLRLGQPDKAFLTAQKSRETNPALLVGIVSAMQDKGEPPDCLLPAIHTALAAVFRLGAQVDFDLFRKLIRATNRAGGVEEARKILNDGVSFAHANARDGWRPLVLLAAASLDIGERDTALNLLQESLHSPVPFLERRAAFGQIAAQFFRLGNLQAFDSVRRDMPTDQQWDVWDDVLRESPVPQDSAAFARNISYGLPEAQQLILHSVIARRLAEAGRNLETSQILQQGFNLARSDASDIDTITCITALEAGLRVADTKVTTEALRLSINIALSKPEPALELSYILVIWHKQLDNSPL
jgi:hypothetical protein